MEHAVLARATSRDRDINSGNTEAFSVCNGMLRFVSSAFLLLIWRVLLLLLQDCINWTLCRRSHSFLGWNMVNSLRAWVWAQALLAVSKCGVIHSHHANSDSASLLGQVADQNVDAWCSGVQIVLANGLLKAIAWASACLILGAFARVVDQGPITVEISVLLMKSLCLSPIPLLVHLLDHQRVETSLSILITTM